MKKSQSSSLVIDSDNMLKLFLEVHNGHILSFGQVNIFVFCLIYNIFFSLLLLILRVAI